MVPRLMLYAEGLERVVLGRALFGEWIMRQRCFHAGRAEVWQSIGLGMPAAGARSGAAEGTAVLPVLDTVSGLSDLGVRTAGKTEYSPTEACTAARYLRCCR